MRNSFRSSHEEGLTNQLNTDQEKKAIIRKALIKASKILDLNQKDLSLIIGFSESKASRLCTNNTYIEPDCKEWDLALLFLRMFRSLDTLFGGNEKQCCLWLHAHNRDLRGIPKELIKNVVGLVEVTQYLDAYRGLA
jgi:hypothetical protein